MPQSGSPFSRNEENHKNFGITTQYFNRLPAAYPLASQLYFAIIYGLFKILSVSLTVYGGIIRWSVASTL
jgi:hypothetical protein